VLLTVSQAARFAQVDEDTMARWITEGRFPVVEPEGPGRVVRIHGDDFANFLARSRTPSMRRMANRRVVEGRAKPKLHRAAH
jgi:excisionase family DNA binding protein